MKHTMRSLVALLMILGLAASLQADDQGERSKSFKVSKGGQLDLSTSSGDVRLNPWNKDEVFVRAYGIDEDELRDLEMTQSGNTVRVSFKPRGRSWSRNVKFEIDLPAEFNVELKTAGGDIDFTGSMKGTLEGTTAGGDINLKDVDGKIEMTTAGGDIKAGKVAGDAHLKTAGGDIEIQDAKGEVEAKTAGGDIKVGNVGKSLQAKTSGGDIRVGDVGGEADVSTAGGDIEVGKVSGRAEMSTAGGDIRLQGASGRVSAKTAGGDIQLRAITGSISAKTAGGDIRADLNPQGTGRSELKTAGGEIELSIPSTAKATIEAEIELDSRWSRRDKYDIRSDFKADTYEKDEDGDYIRATYVLNGGGEIIELKTVNSNITIRKSR